MTGVLLGGLFLLAWGLHPDDAAGPCVVANGPVMIPEIPEASGLAVSRRDPALLWSHNDSGSATVLFALDTAGTVRGRVRLPIRTRDWEDVSTARCASGDCLDIADIGDNRRARQRIQIHRVPEPRPEDEETAPPEVFDDVRRWPSQCGGHVRRRWRPLHRHERPHRRRLPDDTGREPRAHISTHRSAWARGGYRCRSIPR